jgi:hypothetical protein
MSVSLPTTPTNANYCSCGVARSAGIMKVASRDWIKKDYMLNDIPCPLNGDAAKIVYQDESMDVFQNESLDTVPIQQQVSIYD